MRSINFALVVSVGLLLPGTHAAAGTDFLATAQVGSNDIDYESAGDEYSGEVDQVAVSSRFYLTDEYYLAAAYSDSDGKLEKEEYEATQAALGVGAVMLNRVNYRSGIGQELRLGLNYVQAERDFGTSSSDDAWTDLNIAYTAGLGYGFSGFARYQADVEHLSDNVHLAIGVTKHLVAGVLIRAGVEGEVVEYNDHISSTMSGMNVGVGYAF